MKNKSFKRILSIILALVLTLGMLVVPAYAEDDNELEIISSVCVTAVTPTTISVKKINNVYYSLDNTTDWTTDATFYGLYPNTQHKVYYRFGTTGTPKELATVTTKASDSRTHLNLIDSSLPDDYVLPATGYSCTFELKNDLSFFLRLSASKYEGYSNLRILIEHEKYNTDTKEYYWVSSVVYPAKDLYEDKVAGVMRYEFVYSNIASCELNDNLNITLYAEKDGKTYITPLYSKTMVSTAMNMFSSDSSLNRLLADFLNYAAEAQTFFGYNTSKLANANMTAAQVNYATKDDPVLVKAGQVLVDYPNSPATFKKFALSLDSKISLVVETTLASNINKNNVVLKVTYTSPKLGVQNQEYKYNSSLGAFVVNGIEAPDFDVPFEMAVYNGDTIISPTYQYSIETRAYSTVNNANPNIASDVALKKMFYAIIKYSHSAKEYFK